MLPFGIAVYPDARPTKLDPLPETNRLLTLHASQHGLAEIGRNSVLDVVHSDVRVHDVAERTSVRARVVRSARRLRRGEPGTETTSVRRRPTSVPSHIAEYVAQVVIAERRFRARAKLARYIGITTRQLHLAELGSVQFDALPPILAYFSIDLAALPNADNVD